MSYSCAADSETHTESSISSASISYWANHASIQRASQQLHSAQHGAQQAAQHTPQGTTKPSAAVASPVSQYSNVHVPHSTGSSIPAYVETLSVSAPGSASATMDQDAYAYSNTNTSSHPFLPLTPLPDSESSETGNHRKPIIMPPMHVKAGQLPRSSSGRELRDTIDARMHGMHMANQNAKSFRSNPTYQQASVPGSGGLQACSKATSWYHPSGSRKQPQQPPQQQQQQPNSAMHASHAPSFNSVESEQQAAQAALAAYSQNASDSEHLAVVNQQPKATLATVGPQSGTTQRVPSLDLPRDVQQGIEVVSEPAKLSDRSLLRAAQNLQQPRRLPQCPPHHLMNTLPSYMEAAEITPAYRNAYDGELFVAGLQVFPVQAFTWCFCIAISLCWSMSVVAHLVDEELSSDTLLKRCNVNRMFLCHYCDTAIIFFGTHCPPRSHSLFMRHSLHHQYSNSRDWTCR